MYDAVDEAKLSVALESVTAGWCAAADVETRDTAASRLVGVIAPPSANSLPEAGAAVTPVLTRNTPTTKPLAAVVVPLT